MPKGRKRLTAAQMRARGNPHWVERAEEEKAEAESKAATVAEEPDEGEPWDEPSGQLHAAIVESGLSGREIPRRVGGGVRFGPFMRFVRGGCDALCLPEFDALCVHFGLTLANVRVLQEAGRELDMYRRKAASKKTKPADSEAACTEGSVDGENGDGE